MRPDSSLRAGKEIVNCPIYAVGDDCLRRFLRIESVLLGKVYHLMSLVHRAGRGCGSGYDPVLIINRAVNLIPKPGLTTANAGYRSIRVGRGYMGLIDLFARGFMGTCAGTLRRLRTVIVVWHILLIFLLKPGGEFIVIFAKL